MIEKLQAYENYVNELARTKSTELISNGMLEHAAVLVAALLTNAQKEIMIFSSSLVFDVYGQPNVISALKTALASRIKISILLQEYPDIHNDKIAHNFLQLCNPESDLCVIEITNQEEKKKIDRFVIMDRIGYRYCPDASKPEAVASFNRPEKAKVLFDEFMSMFAKGSPYVVSENKVGTPIEA